MHSTKVGIKRKIGIVESESKTKTKVNTVGKTKPPLKGELIIQLKELQEKFDDLENKSKENIKSLEQENETLKSINKNNVEVIKSLKERVGLPNDQELDELDMSEGPRYCVKCDYQAEDGYDLDAHTWSEHEEDASEIDGLTTKSKGKFLECNFCDNKFQTLKNLMMHKKQDHLENVAACWNFSHGNCDFGDKSCWFKHIIEDATKPEEFTCKMCGIDNLSKSSYYKHKKNKHSESVQKCKNQINGKCIYKSENCWFIHDNKEFMEETDESKKEVMNMMKMFTGRILKLEENNK